jgi:GntR family transcriptional regulator/MocR family aminotransferase
MAIQWSGLGPELLLRLVRDSEQPLRSQLETGLRDAIRDGRLQPGERLPSSRELARELGVSRGLVQECYGQLLSEGYLDSHVGSATRVAARAYPAASPAPKRVAAAPSAPRLIADFRSGVPDLASFPRGDWVWAMREACREVATADLDYGDPRGSEALREVLAGYLRRVRAAAVGPEDLIVCTGFAQGLNLSLQVLSQLGVGRVAFEDPGYGDNETSTSVRSAAQPVRVPVDELGVDVAALAATGARAVVVTPAHQSPTGVVLAPARRHELVEWASRHDGYIVEDDYDSEFRYDREPVGVLQGIAPDRVFTVGTVSKALAPSIRLGWVLAPSALSGAVAEEKLLSDRGTSGLDQLALAALLRSGRYDRHLRKMRGVYARRRAVLIGALERHAPGVRLTGLAAGFHAVAHLPEGADEDAVVAEALRRSVGLYGMAPFRAVRVPAPPQLVLGFGLTGERAIEAGIAAVADLLR